MLTPKRHSSDNDSLTPPPKRERVAHAQPIEPINAMALGVTTVHPLQHFIPICFKTDETLRSPWTKMPVVSSATEPMPMLVLLMLDLSPSMSGPFPNDDKCAAAAVVGLLRQLPTYLKKTLTTEQMGCTSLAIAAFSGTVGWLTQNHCQFQSLTTNADDGNWVDGANIEQIDTNTVRVGDTAALVTYTEKWIEKVEKIFVPTLRYERDIGRGTNLEVALFFAHKVAEEHGNSHGGSTQVFLATDGVATCGDCTSDGIRESVDEAIFDHRRGHAVPIQTHVLMMGNGPRPERLTAILGSRGLLGYAMNPGCIASGMDTIFKPVFTEGRGTFDMVTFVSFEDASTGSRVSEYATTFYSQGQLVGDNYTALYGARVPDTFRTAGTRIPSPEQAAGIVVRVVGFCAPNLAQRAFAAKQRRTCVTTAEWLMARLLDEGHEIMLDTCLPVVLDRWWTADNLLDPENPGYVEMPTYDPDTGEYAGGEYRLLRSIGAKETSSSSLYCWIERAMEMLQEINTALGTSVSNRDAASMSARYERMASSTGHTGMARRLVATRLASEAVADREDMLIDEMTRASGLPEDKESQAVFRGLAAGRLGSAAHNAAAFLSQSQTCYMQDTQTQEETD